ncbi:MAG: hypothetical protein V1894_07210 [Chloroflexota bacterium]
MGYYPYRGGAAGILRDKHKTAEAAEYLLADQQIISLAKEVLTPAKYKEAESIAIALTGKKAVKDEARARLMGIVRPPPKRPIYYAQMEIQSLPRWTRDCLRYLGDYVDMLTKTAVYDLQNNKSIFRNSFGPSIKAFESVYRLEVGLATYLRQYNLFLYRPAKHDFTLPRGRTIHRFTSREVVLSACVTMELGRRLCKLSKLAEQVRKDEENI